MSDPGPESAWPPAPERPPTYWGQERPDDPLSAGGMIRRGWRLYRATPGPLLLVALVPELVRTLLAIPGLLLVSRALDGVIDVFVAYFNQVAANPGVYSRAESAALAAELEAQLQAILVPSPEVAVASAVLGAFALATSLVGGGAVTFAVLAMASDRTTSVYDAFRSVVARPGLVRPIAALSIASLAATLIPLALQGSAAFQAWSGEPGSPRSLLLGSLFSLAAFVLFIGIVILAVRWAMYIPVILEESLGVGAGLARAASLSRGIRGRLLLAMLGIFLLEMVSVGVVAVIGALIVGVGATSVQLGFATYVVIDATASLLWAPVLPAILAMAYRARTGLLDEGRPAP